jgi:hypothetical protein
MLNGIFIINEDSTAQLVSSGYYGADFKVSIYNQEEDEYLQENLSTSELKEPIDSFSTETANNQEKNDTELELKSTDDLNVSDRIQIGNYIYKVISILDKTVTLHKGLYEAVSSDTSVDRKGNLAIYKLTINIDTLGDFTLMAKDSVFGLTKNQMITVKPKSIETMYKDIKNLEYAILGS